MDHISIMRFLVKGNKSFWEVPSSLQRDYLYSLPEPNNGIERSFLQYKCHNFFAPHWKPIVLNILAFFAFFPLLLIYVLKGFLIRNRCECDAISDLNDMQEIIPERLKSELNFTFIDNNPIGALKLKDIPFVLLLFLRFPSCYFSLKAMAKVAQYSQMISCYNPKCIVAHLEYSFSSSLLTVYCNKRGVRHINVMHGEKMYNIIDAFFQFNECYVWNEHYKKLFIDMRAEPSQFIIDLPPSMRINVCEHINHTYWADYKYYLAIFNEEEIKSIVKSMYFAVKKGMKVKYRYHPRHANLDILSKYIKPDDIEDPHQVSIIESLSNCGVAVGSYSTVLNQAYHSGIQILLDDVTYQGQYEKLKDLKYILIDKKCNVLSSMK